MSIILQNYLEEIYLQENILSKFQSSSMRKKIVDTFKDISKYKIRNIDDIKQVYNKLNFIPYVSEEKISKIMSSKLPNFQKLKMEASKKLKIKDPKFKPHFENLYVLARYLEEDEEIPEKVKKSSGELLEKIIFWTALTPIILAALLYLFIFSAIILPILAQIISFKMLIYFTCFVLTIFSIIYIFVHAE